MYEYVQPAVIGILTFLLLMMFFYSKEIKKQIRNETAHHIWTEIHGRFVLIPKADLVGSTWRSCDAEQAKVFNEMLDAIEIEGEVETVWAEKKDTKIYYIEYGPTMTLWYPLGKEKDK